jgi:hypothetical protein
MGGATARPTLARARALPATTSFIHPGLYNMIITMEEVILMLLLERKKEKEKRRRVKRKESSKGS